MTNEELKKKIVKVLKETINWTTDYSIPIGIVYKSELDEIADVLIAAGLKFDVLTETEYQKYCAYKIIEPQIKGCLDREKELEKRLAEAEHRAEVAERALSSLVHEMYEHDIRPMCDEKFFIESRLIEAEKELVEERE